MTIKTTILISAATFFVLNFILWAVGWMIWPIGWIGLGYASLKFWWWTMEKEFHNPTPFDFGQKLIAVISGPIMGMVAFACDGHKYMEWPKWLPKIRNPFI